MLRIITICDGFFFLRPGQLLGPEYATEKRNQLDLQVSDL